MSIKDKDKAVPYQSKEVALPEDHYESKPVSHYGRILNLSILLGILGILAIVAWTLKLHFFHREHILQPDQDKTRSSTLLRIDAIADGVDSVLLNLNQSIEGRVWISSRDKQDEFAQAAFVWRQDLKPPRAVIEVATEEDVQLVMPVLSQLDDIPFRIRSGGHSKAGFSTVADGIVLSLKHLKQRSIQSDDQNNIIATIQPGSTVEDVLDHFLEHAAEHDDEQLYAGALGQCGKVAEGGWVLGGGVGFMARLLGLGVDSVREFRVVLANGTAVTSNEDKHQDLFWALRGAGQGNYGVVTAMTYQLYRAPDTQLFLKVMLPPQDMADFMYDLGALNTDREFFLVVGGREDQLVTMFVSWFSLQPDVEENTRKGKQHFQQEIAPILPSSAIFNNSYQKFLWAEETHLLFDHGYGLSVFAAQPWQGFLLPVNNTREVWDEIMKIMAKGMEIAPDLEPHIELWGGAISDVDVEDTAFPYRDAVYNVGVLLVIREYDDTARERYEQQVESVNSWWPEMAQYLTGSYQNYPMNSLQSEEYPRLYWGDHLEQLVEIKQRYDPRNVFAFEQSMPIEL